MFKLAAIAFVVFGAVVAASGQTTAYGATKQDQSAASPTVPSMPSEEEIGELIAKAKEYVETYRRVFKDAKPALEKVPDTDFYNTSVHLCDQATTVITAIQKNGSTAVSLVSLLVILDDMSLQAAKASGAAFAVAITEDKSNPSNHAMQDFQDTAQAGKNCYDIAELLVHATLRYISTEEAALKIMLDQQKPQ